VGFASGCGITPVLSVAKAILQADSTDQFILVYGNSSTGRVMCLEQLLGLKNRYLDRLALHFVMSREPQEVELYNGRVDAVRVHELARTLFKPEQVAQYFVCGPGDMIEQVSGALRELNVSAERIHGEHFTVVGVTGTDDATAVGTVVADLEGPGGAVASPFARSAARATDSAEVTVLMDGRRRTFTMRMNDDTVLDAAMGAGLELPFSCRAGVCSTCRTKVVSGEVEMAQNYALEEWELEQGYVLACQSRVKTPTLELDYDEK
jgi:ring-1,2-phenylacetyl-CoA epoxidase subunit PaaE